MRKTPLSLTMATSVLLAMTACQPNSGAISEPNSAPDSEPNSETMAKDHGATTPSSTLSAEKEVTDSLKPKVSAASDSNADSNSRNATPIASSASVTVDKQVCTTVTNAIEAVDNKSKIAEIYAVQDLLNDCLPAANNATVLRWLAAYQAMYERFLALDNTDDSDQSHFYTVMETALNDQKVPAESLKTMNPRVQYLLGLVERKADVSVQYLGEGDFRFHHDLKAMADLFTPYLRQDQVEFIQQMARDNQSIFWFDAGVAVSYDDLIKRAQFWESYVQRYSKGYAIEDAKILLNIYRDVLFFGSENTQWTDDAIREFYDPAAKRKLQQLAKRSKGILTKDAQRYLTFMSLSDSERELRYPVPALNHYGDEMKEREIARYQLIDALQIPSPWTGDSNRHCLEGVLCTSYTID